MEEEAQKRNTDCLYFLASPLTCKKGMECEYRHSDNARLNPRDCWYWLNGNCRNPNCAFRHPPLEGFSGVKADSFYNTPSFSAVPPVTKSSVPCYFYFNAVCVKGEQCPFLHETFLPQKLASKFVPESTAAGRHPLENKFSAGDTGPASIELLGNPPPESSVGPNKTDNHHPKEVSCSPSVESMAPECEDPPAENPLPSVEFMDDRSQLSPYSSSEELVKECVGQELDERWESSPGFDVLVDDGSEQLAYEDDADYQLVQSRESELRRSHLLEYDFEGSGYGHHSGYPDAYSLDGLYDHGDDIYAGAEYFERISELPMEDGRLFEPIYEDLHEWRLLRRAHEFNGRDGVMDLQDRLGKQRTDARWIPFNSRKRRRSDPYGSGRERPERRGVGDGSIHGRLGSQAGGGRRPVAASPPDEEEFACNHHDRQGWQGGNPGTNRSARSRIRERERRHRFASRVSSGARRSFARDGEEPTRITSNGNFDGPKTLAQIKEERTRAKAGDCENDRGMRQAAADFEGPKSLGELLKRRSSKQEKLDADEDDGDDADVFRKRLAHVLSH